MIVFIGACRKVFKLEEYAYLEAVDMDERYVEMVVRTARTTEGDVGMAAGRYGQVIIGYIGDPQWTELVYPNPFEAQNLPNFLIQNFPNPFNWVRRGRELTDKIGSARFRRQMIQFKLVA